MKIYNIHERIIAEPKEKISPLLETLATKEDKIWPTQNWPPMWLDKGLEVGSTGGHGPIKYTVQQYIPEELIEFKFKAPKGFDGIHKFEIQSSIENQTVIKHIIDANISGTALLTWPLGIRWLHDALIEDAFDQIGNHFSREKKRTKWNLWVKLLRKALN